MREMLTQEQVDLVEQLEGYVEWIEISGRISREDVDYFQSLIDYLAESISKREKENELVEKGPWAEGLDCQGAGGEGGSVPSAGEDGGDGDEAPHR